MAFNLHLHLHKSTSGQRAGDGTAGDRTLYNFNDVSGPAQAFPLSGVVFDALGNIYGSTVEGFYKLTPNSAGGWDAKTLHSLPALVSTSQASLLLDAVGNVYGVDNVDTSGSVNFNDTGGGRILE